MLFCMLWQIHYTFNLDIFLCSALTVSNVKRSANVCVIVLCHNNLQMIFNILIFRCVKHL